MDRVPLWRGNHVAIKQLVEDFARYLYLPRLRDPSVLLKAVKEGLPLMGWSKDSFAYTEAWDEETGRYKGLRGGQPVSSGTIDSPGLLVQPELAKKNSWTRKKRRQKNQESPQMDRPPVKQQEVTRQRK